MRRAPSPQVSRPENDTHFENRQGGDRAVKQPAGQQWSWFSAETRSEQRSKETSVGSPERKTPADEAAGDVTVYYSTPFGDTKDGKHKLFLLARDGVPFFPVFYSKESMKELYERTNRAAYMIIEGDISAVMNSIRSIEPMKNAGIVIEPFSEHPVEIMPDS